MLVDHRRLTDKRHDVESAARRVINARERRFIIANDHQFKGGSVGEEIAAHEPRRNRIAAIALTLTV
jgi:hypothetical protein